MNPKPYFCYVLWTPAGHQFYTGITDDLAHRIIQHNNGESKWTNRHAGSWKIVWHRQFPSLGEARKFENLIKRQKSGDGFWHLTGLSRSAFPDL